MLPEFKKIILDNGFEIYHIPCNEGSGVISTDIFYKVGSRNEYMGKSGIAHMLEHMNFKSTKNRKAGVFDKTVKGFGGIDNASTGFDYTHYFIKCANSNLDISCELFADIMQNLNLKDEEFKPERNVVLEERLWRTDNNPAGFLFFRLYNSAFIYHPYHWTPIGFKKDIENWTIEDIKNFHAKFYQPQNAFLVIAGDIDEKSAFKSAKKHFEKIKNSSDIPVNFCKEPTQNGERNIIIHKNSEVEMIALAYKIPPFNHADQNALSAVENILGSGKSSVIRRILVDEKKLANDVEIYNMSSIDENLFIIFAVANFGIKAEILKSEILEILENLKQKEIEDEALEKVRNALNSQFVYSLDSAGKIADIYGNFIAMGDISVLFELPQKIQNLTKMDIKNCFLKYFDKNKLTSVILRKE